MFFLLTGLWHGADFSFIIWGLYHGFFIVIERLGIKKILDKSRILSVICCFLIVNFGWVLFRSGDIITGIRYIARMITPWRYGGSGTAPWHYMDSKTLFVGIIAVAGMGIIRMITPEKLKEMWNNSAIEAIYCIILLILSLAAIASDTYNPFIYFQF